MSLSVSGLVRVGVNLSPQAAAVRSFGTLMVAGDSDVINGLERFRTYLNLEGVAADFGVNAPEYKAAEKYFGQTPKPRTIMIGKWNRVASAGQNLGGILSSSEQEIENWTAISNGGFVISIDGESQALSALDFSGVTNLNGVASVINSSLTGASIAWDGSSFIVTSSTAGAGARSVGTITLASNPSYGVRAFGTITLTGNPANGNTVSIKGTTVTFVTGTPGPLQVEIGADADETAANLQAFLQASADANLAANTYNTIDEVTTITARVYGTAGNSYALTKVGANITVSGAGTLTGGVAAETLTVNGTALTFVASAPGANEILVGPTKEATAANLQAFLAASEDANIAEATYATALNVTTVTALEVGTDGDAFTLAETGSSIDLSGANLEDGADASTVSFATPGAGTDISALLKLDEDNSQGLIDGYDAESPVECAAVLANMSAAWYGLMFQASVQPTDEQNIDVAGFINGLDLKRIFGVTIVNTDVLSAVVSNDLASQLMDLGYKQAFCQYSQNAYAIASFFGRAFSVNFNANRSTITMMFKQEPGVAGEELTETQALTLKAKRCNVFVAYNNDTVIIQHGVMSGLAYFDEIHGLDWLQNAIQTACYNVLYTSATKIPQTDAGTNRLTTAISDVCTQARTNGLIAPGIWTADGFGELATGQYLNTGFYILAGSMALQSQSDREARIAPPIQVAIKLAGAIQSLDVLVDVNR